MPLPSVPAPPVGGWPPVSTVLLAWMIAWRNGCTPMETLAMIAIPASTATGRSQPMSTSRSQPLLTGRTGRAARAWAGTSGPSATGVPGRGNRSSRGQGSPEGAGSTSGHAQDVCHAQWPRQVQCLARPSTSAVKLTSHGRGGRRLILVRIRSSASVPGSTWLTASDRCLPECLLQAVIWCGHGLTGPAVVGRIMASPETGSS